MVVVASVGLLDDFSGTPCRVGEPALSTMNAPCWVGVRHLDMVNLGSAGLPRPVPARSAAAGLASSLLTASPYLLAPRLRGSQAHSSPRRRALGVVAVVRLHPRHQLAQLAAGLLDRVLLTLGPQRLELRTARVLVVDEPLGERAVLDLGQDVLHVLLDPFVDDQGSGDVVAILRGVGDRPSLL